MLQALRKAQISYDNRAPAFNESFDDEVYRRSTRLNDKCDASDVFNFIKNKLTDDVFIRVDGFDIQEAQNETFNKLHDALIEFYEQLARVELLNP